MNIAFLFNSDHPSLGGYYGPPIMDRILGVKVLQGTDRHMRVSIGDILTYSAAAASRTPTIAFLVKLCKAVYKPTVFDKLLYARLEATHGKATVFCWLFQNMTASVGEALHLGLTPDPAYLGAMDVDFSTPLHLLFFRNSLCEEYRLLGKRCSIFYRMGQNEDPDIVVREYFERHGFSVTYENAGARRTIFDKYDSIEHFKRIDDFKMVFSEFDGIGVDRASDLVLSLEELHPKLFDAFAAAARTLKRAETGEDYAQAALSGRRLLEKTADYLFPPQEGLRNGRKVGQAEYKNRIWAYLEQAATASPTILSDPNVLTRLGTEADRIVSLFNSGLHAEATREAVEAAFSAFVIWLSHVIELAPSVIRKPYLAYEEELTKFADDIMRE